MNVCTLFPKFVLGFLAVHFTCAECKVQSGTLTFGESSGNQESQWKFISKFGYAVALGAIGTGRYEIRLKLRDVLDQDQALPRPTLEIFLDEDWPQHESVRACRRAQDLPARKTHGTLSPGQFLEYQTVRSHIWYFAPLAELLVAPVVFACYTVDYEIHWRSRLSASSLSSHALHCSMTQYMPLATVLVLVILTAMACRFVVKSQSMRHSTGRGLPVADGFAEVLFMLSQVGAASLLIAIAQGYSLLSSSLSEAGPQQTSIDLNVLKNAVLGTSHRSQVELLVPVVAIVSVLHIALVAVGKLQAEARG
eukprot:Skav234347  [mRNA]  locus=scaffold1274:18093:24074:+ [translate_table: standard]